jgi:ribose 5-phosphate isomerase B
MKILIASDHAGFEMKSKILKHFSSQYEFLDLGTNTEKSVDYPDFAHVLASKISNGEEKYGILLCGSGNGMSMAANKHPNVRAAICWNPEIALLARQHNDANILVLPARFVLFEELCRITKVFFQTSFEGGRHQNRVNKINL